MAGTLCSAKAVLQYQLVMAAQINTNALVLELGILVMDVIIVIDAQIVLNFLL
jgi:hypothetical protein